jgi:D-lactate dehydrogenase
MKNLYLVETQDGDSDFFRVNLPEYLVRCVEDLGEVDADAEVVSIFLHSHIDAQFLDSHPKLKLVTTRSTGYDHIDVDACAGRGIAVCNVCSVDENTVAEHTFALMLAVARRLLEVHEANKLPRFCYEALRGIDLRGRTLGVIGTGRVGLHVVHIAIAFGMKLLAYDPYNRSLMSELLGVCYVPLDELLRCSHVISLHVPLTSETHHMLDRQAFAKCRPGVIVINTARGALIDTAALVEALDAGLVAGAGLDVLEDESVMQKEAPRVIADQIIENIQDVESAEELRIKHPERVKELETVVENGKLLTRRNVVFTPHVAFNSVEGVQQINTTTVANIKAFFEGHPINLIQPTQNNETPHSLGYSRELAGTASSA